MAYANYRKPFKQHTDASEHRLGTVVYQKQYYGMDHMIASASQTLSKSERNYDAHKLEFLALKWSVTERFHEYLYGGHLEVYTDNNSLTYILTTAKLDATGQRWVASLANYNFKIFYRSGKLNVESDALSRIPWENTHESHLAPLIVNTMLQSKLGTELGIPEVYPQQLLIQKCMLVDSSPELAHDDWIREQSEDTDIGLLVQLLKPDKLKRYVARETDSSGILSSFEIQEGCVLEEWIIVLKGDVEKSLKTNISVCTA